jgi:hypothetical protein
LERGSCFLPGLWSLNFRLPAIVRWQVHVGSSGILQTFCLGWPRTMILLISDPQICYRHEPLMPGLVFRHFNLFSNVFYEYY